MCQLQRSDYEGEVGSSAVSQNAADVLSTLSSCAVYLEFEGVDPTDGERKNLLIYE